MNGFAFIGGIGLLFHDDLRMYCEKSFVVEADVSDDAQTVIDNAEFISIAKMPIDVKLFDDRVCCGMRRYGTIGCFYGS